MGRKLVLKMRAARSVVCPPVISLKLRLATNCSISASDWKPLHSKETIIYELETQTKEGEYDVNLFY